MKICPNNVTRNRISRKTNLFPCWIQGRKRQSNDSLFGWIWCASQQIRSVSLVVPAMLEWMTQAWIFITQHLPI